jgi:hypothetical protein
VDFGVGEDAEEEKKRERYLSVPEERMKEPERIRGKG